MTARAAVEGGADVLSLVNTFTAMAIDIYKRRPRLANVTGGLSGPAIKPIALHMVSRVYRRSPRHAGVPIIGMGGVQTWQDAVEFILAGATRRRHRHGPVRRPRDAEQDRATGWRVHAEDEGRAAERPGGGAGTAGGRAAEDAVSVNGQTVAGVMEASSRRNDPPASPAG